MSNNNEILIEDIENSENGEIQIHYEDFIDGIKTKNPIIADLNFRDLGDLIEVKGSISGVAILQCDLCLEDFDYTIDIDVDEMFSKQASYPNDIKAEIEIKDDNFTIDLEGADRIDLSDFIYQTIILDFPNKKVCDINCNGGDIFIRDENLENEDPRMSVFKNIKIDR